ncbi:unnamed protein product [Mytilus coruscus]|uniref:DNA helicase Pif1-like 2B domain-containing protein n=1 Tax=Mytilus coruscus TaxID=42192 RepID=A0A6J8DYM4_MYTCO|nr:unnamed protein product [Mytilus coruscus]
MTLPRNISEAQLIKVKLKRKTSYQDYYKFRWINPTRVLEAVSYLMKYNKWYENVRKDISWKINNDDCDLLKQDIERTDHDSEDEQSKTPHDAGSNIYKMSLPISVIKSRSRKGDGNDENIWMVSIHEKYYARQNLSIFNDMFLAEFASKFFILSNSQNPKSSELSPVYQLQNNLGYVKRRKENKAAVIKYPKFSSEKNPEDYYLSLLQLFLPHRDSMTLPSGVDSYQQLATKGRINGRIMLNIIEENRHHFEIDTKNLEKAWQDVKEGKVQETSWASLAPEVEIDRIESEMEKTVEVPEEAEDIPELRFQKQTSEKHSFHYESPKFSQKEIAQDLRKMNNIQQKLLRIHTKKKPLEEKDLKELIKASKSETPENMKNALHIFPTNGEVNSHNSAMICKICKPIYTALAKDYFTDVVTGHLQQKDEPIISCTPQDLETELQIGIGARVMLTRNIDTEDGLVNGAFGSVTGVHLDAHEQVTAVNVKFDNDKIGKKHLKKSVIIDASLKGSVRIKLFQDNLYGKKFIRKQIPLKLAWAATIHKVQGMTVQQIVVSLKKIFQPGMAYVALSRATTLSGLVILDFNPNAISSSENITEALQQMPTFLSPQLVPEPSNLFSIVHHNTEGLLPHLSDVKAMKQFERADVICFTETWLSKHHTVDATLYPEYTRYNLLRSEAYNKDNILLSEKIYMNRGGVAIFIKQSLPQQKFLFETQNLEVVGVIVNNAFLLTVYRPPSYPLQLFIEFYLSY